VQPEYTLKVWLVVGLAPWAAQKVSATVVPSDCKQETLRLSVAAIEHEELGAPQADTFQL
jgi:hypothetical protein